MSDQPVEDVRQAPSLRIAESAVYTSLARLLAGDAGKTIPIAERVLVQIAQHIADSAHFSGRPEDVRQAIASLASAQQAIAGQTADLLARRD